MSEPGDQPGDARRAVTYLVVAEADQYIAIMGVLDGSVNDLSTGEVATALARAGATLNEATTNDRLDQLRRWGAVTARSDTSSAQRYADLIARNWRWSATSTGRQVHRFYNAALASTRTMREIPIASLQQVVAALADLEALDLEQPGNHPAAAQATNRLFTAHDNLDSALVGAEDALTSLADRFDLDTTGAAELKGLLVEYATRISSELDSGSTLAHRTLSGLADRFDGLAAIAVASSDAQELISRGALQASRGGRAEDWAGLMAWCAPGTGRATAFGMRLVRALPAMHANLRRLHATTGQATIRSRMLSLAQAAADPQLGAQVFTAALGDHPWRKLHGETDDTDPGQTPSWRDGPQTTIPEMLRTTGRTGARGRIAAARDHTEAAREVALRRDQRAQDRARAVAEVLADATGTLTPVAASAALDVLMSAARNTPHPDRPDRRTATADGLTCTLFHCPGQTGRLRAPTWSVATPDRIPVFHAPRTIAHPPATTTAETGPAWVELATVGA